MIKLNVEYEIEHKIENRTSSRFLDMTTQAVINGTPFTLDTIKENQELILETVVNFEYESSDRAQVQIEALGTGVDEFTKYGINWQIVTFEDQAVVLK